MRCEGWVGDDKVFMVILSLMNSHNKCSWHVAYAPFSLCRVHLLFTYTDVNSFNAGTVFRRQNMTNNCNLKSSQMYSYLFLLHLNTYVMGQRPLSIFYSFSAGIDFRQIKQMWYIFSHLNLWVAVDTTLSRRQILTAKVDPRTVRVKIFRMVIDP